MRRLKDILKEDRLLLAAFAGFIAALGANLSLYLMNRWLPGHNVNMPQVALEMFLDSKVSYSFVTSILGVIWSTVVGGTYALIYLAALDLTGWNNLWLKAIIIVNGTWFFGAGLLMHFLHLTVYTHNEPLSVAAFYVAHLLFATFLSFIVIMIGQERSQTGKYPLTLKPEPETLQHDSEDDNLIKTIKPKKLK